MTVIKRAAAWDCGAQLVMRAMHGPIDRHPVLSDADCTPLLLSSIRGLSAIDVTHAACTIAAHHPGTCQPHQPALTHCFSNDPTPNCPQCVRTPHTQYWHLLGCDHPMHAVAACTCAVQLYNCTAVQLCGAGLCHSSFITAQHRMPTPLWAHGPCGFCSWLSASALPGQTEESSF